MGNRYIIEVNFIEAFQTFEFIFPQKLALTGRLFELNYGGKFHF